MKQSKEKEKVQEEPEGKKEPEGQGEQDGAHIGHDYRVKVDYK